MTSFLCLGNPERSLYQVGIVVLKANIDGSERSARFSRQEESLPSALRTLPLLKFPLHSLTIDVPEEINVTNSPSVINQINSLLAEQLTVFHFEFYETDRGRLMFTKIKIANEYLYLFQKNLFLITGVITNARNIRTGAKILCIP